MSRWRHTDPSSNEANSAGVEENNIVGRTSEISSVANASLPGSIVFFHDGCSSHGEDGVVSQSPSETEFPMVPASS